MDWNSSTTLALPQAENPFEGSSLENEERFERFERVERPKPTYSILWFFCKIGIAFGTVIALIVGYALNLKIVSVSSVTSIGLYGVAILIDYVFQLSCAIYNRKDVERIIREKRTSNLAADTALFTNGARPEREKYHDSSLLCPYGGVTVTVVGYREDEDAWRQCLRSLRAQTLQPSCIVAVVDGNEAEDMVMAAAFQDEFFDHPRARVIELPTLLSAEHRAVYAEALEDARRRRGHAASSRSIWAETRRWLSGTFTPEEKEAQEIALGAVISRIHSWKREFQIDDDLDAVCFVQPHGHKRTAMFTSFLMALHALDTRHAVFTTDSDTKLHPNALDELLCLLLSDDSIGGVTGEVCIWNANKSWLTRMCMVRYWMAFNVERGCQSVWRCVVCLSGVMGMYRACDLADIVGRWNVQSFGGRETTFGDDRHMTNQLLATGVKTRHTHRAVCDSESPEQFVRWIRQQTRWSKSFYREVFWFPSQLLIHSWWLLFEAVKNALFPFILIGTLFHMLYSPTNPWRPIIWVSTIWLVAFIKSLVALIISGDPWMLAFAGYGFVYFFGLLPSKVWALFTLTQTTWGTSARSSTERKRGETFLQRSFHVGYLCAWYLTISFGLGYYLSKIFHSWLYMLVGVLGIPPCVGVYVDSWSLPSFSCLKSSKAETGQRVSQSMISRPRQADEHFGSFVPPFAYVEAEKQRQRADVKKVRKSISSSGYSGSSTSRTHLHSNSLSTIVVQ